MSLSIVIKSYHRAVPELKEMLEDYVLDGGTILRKGDDRVLPLDSAGESALTQEQYESLNAVEDIRFEYGIFYAIITEAKKDNLVPVAWPASKTTDEEGNEVRVSYEDYFRKATQHDLGDGTWLFRVSRSVVGLSNTDRLLYQEDLGTLLVKSEGLALIPESPEV